MLIQRIYIKQSGMTLTELMIALAVNALLLAGLLFIFVRSLDHYRSSIEESRLNQQMQSAMKMMTNEIKRAGYWVNAKNDLGTDTNTNPFMVGGNDITVSMSGDCILLGYDYDKNGSVAPISTSTDDERYGFRLMNNAIQVRPPGADFNCAAAASVWEDVTDTGVIQISALTFTLNEHTVVTGPGTIGLLMRSVDISMTGSLTRDATVTKTLTQHVRVRNDKFTQ